LYTSLYMRVSSSRQETKSQEADLLAYMATLEARGEEVRVFREKATGTNYDRPQWQKLWDAVLAGQVQRIVVWRLDRLGRLAGATIQLLDELEVKGVAFLSIRDGFDPSTPAGRLTRNVLASVAQFETEVRVERIMAGQAAARAAGKVWGGGKAGRRVTLTVEKERAIKQLHHQGKGISEIARVVGLSRPTIYRVLG
jgi:DNA invertase Pin-like site-specific DNA recombinase